jgi:hypothetical protein
MITVGQANPNRNVGANRKVVPRMLRSAISALVMTKKEGALQIPRYAACTCLLFASSTLVPCMITLPLSST